MASQADVVRATQLLSLSAYLENYILPIFKSISNSVVCLLQWRKGFLKASFEWLISSCHPFKVSLASNSPTSCPLQPDFKIIFPFYLTSSWGIVKFIILRKFCFLSFAFITWPSSIHFLDRFECLSLRTA